MKHIVAVPPGAGAPASAAQRECPAMHPYRGSPPCHTARVHRPGGCAYCMRPRLRHRTGWRTFGALLFGVAGPGASLLVNAQMHVVDLGVLGTAALLGTMLSVLLHLWLAPVAFEPASRQLIVGAPRSLALRLLLVGCSAFSVTTCVYLALLFIPLLPLSIILVVYGGLGLCGLTPYPAATLAVMHLVRDVRALRARVGRRWAYALALAALLAPPAGIGALAAVHAVRRQQVASAVSELAGTPQHSRLRMGAIAALAGTEDQVVDLYMKSELPGERRLLAETYHRLTDSTLHEAVHRRRKERRHSLIQPFSFLHGAGAFGGNFLWFSRGW